jgi:hypothetical protein
MQIGKQINHVHSNLPQRLILSLSWSFLLIYLKEMLGGTGALHLLVTHFTA